MLISEVMYKTTSSQVCQWLENTQQPAQIQSISLLDAADVCVCVCVHDVICSEADVFASENMLPLNVAYVLLEMENMYIFVQPIVQY